MLSVILVAIVLAFAQSQKREFSCFINDGFYCTNDLAGYHDCTLMWLNPVNPPQYCPSGTRCSCFINTKCEVPESEICQPIQIPPKLPEDFDYTFSLQGSTTQGAWIQELDQLKRVIRNTDLEMLRERTWNLKRIWNLKTLEQSFEVVLPTVGGKFDYYTGSYSSSVCNKEVIDTFPDFWPDLSKFQLVKTNGEIQVWESKVGSTNPGEDSFHTILELQVAEGTVIPLRYESYKSGGQNSKHSFAKIRKLRVFEALKRSSNFFQKPAVCL